MKWKNNNTMYKIINDPRMKSCKKKKVLNENNNNIQNHE